MTLPRTMAHRVRRSTPRFPSELRVAINMFAHREGKERSYVALVSYMTQRATELAAAGMSTHEVIETIRRESFERMEMRKEGACR